MFPSFLYISRNETRCAARGRRQPFNLDTSLMDIRGELNVQIQRQQGASRLDQREELRL